MTDRIKLATKMRIAVLACCVATAGVAPMLAQDTSGAPQAQQGGGRRNSAEMEQRRLDMMTRQLNLSPDQVTQVKAILDSESQQMAALREGGDAQGDRRSQMMSIRQASQAKIRATLTDDQKAKFDAMQERMRQRRGGGEGGPPPQM